MKFTITIPDERVARINERLEQATVTTDGPGRTKIVQPQFPNGCEDWLQQIIAQNLYAIDPNWQDGELAQAIKAAEDAAKAAEELKRRKTGVAVQIGG